jgi:hypothetical protein
MRPVRYIDSFKDYMEPICHWVSFESARKLMWSVHNKGMPWEEIFDCSVLDKENHPAFFKRRKRGIENGAN